MNDNKHISRVCWFMLLSLNVVTLFHCNRNRTLNPVSDSWQSGEGLSTQQSNVTCQSQQADISANSWQLSDSSCYQRRHGWGCAEYVHWKMTVVSLCSILSRKFSIYLIESVVEKIYTAWLCFGYTDNKVIFVWFHYVKHVWFFNYIFVELSQLVIWLN